MKENKELYSQKKNTLLLPKLSEKQLIFTVMDEIESLPTIKKLSFLHSALPSQPEVFHRKHNTQLVGNHSKSDPLLVLQSVSMQLICNNHKNTRCENKDFALILLLISGNLDDNEECGALTCGLPHHHTNFHACSIVSLIMTTVTSGICA